MKIKTKHLPYETVMALPRTPHRDPMRPLWLLRAAIRVASLPTLIRTRFRFTQERMELVKDTPCLILMNHSSFTDLKIAYRVFFPRRLSIVATTDSFVGKGWLMRLLGCIPTQKFVSDMTLIRDMHFALSKRKSSVLMFPEAGYSLDGRATVLPRHLGVLLKRLKAPVVTVTTYGAYHRDPLYNGLRKRSVPVSAKVKCILTPEESREKSLDELDAMIAEAFDFDQFAWQKESGVVVDEPFRAEGLHRMLYQCADCGARGCMTGKGVHLTCEKCGKAHMLQEDGTLRATAGATRFAHIPDWFDWQRQQVEAEIASGAYHLDAEVSIAMLVDDKALYQVGEGRLTHDAEGFHLTGCDGKLDYRQPNTASHSLNVDYYWYEIGDMISIGDRDALYYCFPREKDVVTRTRLAQETFYRMQKG